MPAIRAITLPDNATFSSRTRMAVPIDSAKNGLTRLDFLRACRLKLQDAKLGATSGADIVSAVTGRVKDGLPCARGNSRSGHPAGRPAAHGGADWVTRVRRSDSENSSRTR